MSTTTKVIISIICILACIILIVLPFWGKVRITTKESRVKHQINVIVMAIKHYESTFELLPWDSHSPYKDMVFGASNISEYNTLFELLSCADGPDADTPHVKNSRGIRFIDLNEYYNTKGYIDCWDNRFKIYLDTDYDGKVKVGDDTLAGCIFVYSYGKNGKDDQGKKDDIGSWKN